LGKIRPEITMCDFIYGGCQAVKESHTFLTFWLATRRKPCLICDANKTKCDFYYELIDKGIVTLDQPLH
jgi:hypothetical protein